MKTTLPTYRAIQLLLDDEYASWSLQGARSLVEHLEQLDEDMDTESEFDPIAYRCNYTEYGSAVEALADYTSDKVEDEDEAMEHLMQETIVISFKGGVIILNY